MRLVGEQGKQIGLMPLHEAMEHALQADLDLVEIAPQADPPVCRLMDYGKFRYSSSKKRHETKRKQKQIVIKEIKFRPNTDKGDYDIKVRNLRKFLSVGNKVKITIRVRGREMSYPQLGVEVLDNIKRDLAEEAVVEQEPQMEGRQLVMLMNPVKR